MCGINGTVLPLNRCSRTASFQRVEAMNRAIRHRGPDGTGVIVDDEIALGHVRLAILDLSDDGAQPMRSNDGRFVLTFNGEIYNYIELRNELINEGYEFRSRTDSEVIIYAYAAWGEDCVKRFNGMWAFAIWDHRERHLFISRDRLGVKPLYFRADGDMFVFSSELKGIHAAIPLTRANPGKIHDYLAYGCRVNDGETFFAGVNELLPGHNLSYRDGSWSVSQYWTLPNIGPAARREMFGPPEERRRKLEALLKDAVLLRFRSDVPVALLQSGGLDSAVIATIVNESLRTGELEAERVLAITAHFPGSEYDEVGVVTRLFSGFDRIGLQTVELNEGHLADNIYEFVREIGEPVASPTSFAHWSLMKELRHQGIKCVINGQGADEAFAGYIRYVIGYRLLDLAMSNPGAVWGQALALQRQYGFGLSYLVAQIAKAIAGRRAAFRLRSRLEGTADLLSPGFRRENDCRVRELSVAMAPNNLYQTLHAQLEYYGFNQILHYEDHSSMSQGIEIRSPFVDYRVMEFAAGLPDADKLHDGRSKKIIRDIYRGRVPEYIIDSRVKIGFNTPSQSWLVSESMKPIYEELCGRDLRCRTIWNESKLRQILRSRRFGKLPVWRFLNVELWAREYGVTNL